MTSRIAFLLSFLFLLTALSGPLAATTGNGTIRGRVLDAVSRSPVPFANVVVEGTQTGSTTDISGDFVITNVTPGFVRLTVSYVGYKTKTTEELYVTREKAPYVEILLEPTVSSLDEVVISGPKFIRREESPVSMQTIGIREIERNPGGNRDISKIIQSLPGVASNPGFRNDIIIRGGAPAENKFYLDGIEVPVMNHFQTQGSSGGPVGIINVNFIREVDFYSGAFPASRGNALSSVIEFKQIEGSKDRTGIRAAVGSSDMGLTADGPLGKKTTYIFSVRQSYLQFLFSLFKLPFLPTFYDTQFKVNHKINNKNEVSLIGLGGYDIFRLNKKVNDDITDTEQLEYNNYILGNIPVNSQWNYTTGIVYKHFGPNSVTQVIVSRNELYNKAEKYLNNDESTELNKKLDYTSGETENKLRIENSRLSGNLRISAGVGAEYNNYSAKGFDNRPSPYGPVRVEFDSRFNLVKYALFLSVSKPVFKNKLQLSAGLRTDGNNYSAEMSNPARQLSPRLAASLSITEKWSLNFNTGRYYQLPAYTIMGYSDAAGNLVNKQNKLQFIYADHLVGGVQFNPDNSTKVTVEGFYKQYGDYPLSLADSISMANLGSDFGVFGNEAVASVSKGRARGVEFLIQRRSQEGVFGILAYTFVRSEFSGVTSAYYPSAWDNKHLLSITAGKKLGRNWDAGLKWRYAGGQPYTPYDTLASSLKANWDAKGRGVPDYDLLNSRRLDAFHQLDIRIDKTWFLKKWSVNIYLDIQNVYNFTSREQDILTVVRDENDAPVTDPAHPDRYLIRFLKDETGTVLPTIGLIVDF